MSSLHDLRFFSANELRNSYSNRDISPTELVRFLLSAIESEQPRLNAFSTIAADMALASARASEHRWVKNDVIGPFDGIPISIKDLIVASGCPTYFGSFAVKGECDRSSDPCTDAMINAGAIILGKTTTPEFGNGGTTKSKRHGITRNPWNPSLTPGGSSGGSAAATAAGLGVLSIGTDSGGSVRTPASFCGVAAAKPTFGFVPQPKWLDCNGMGVTGPIARKVADLAAFLDLFQGSRRSFSSTLNDPLPRLRVAYSADLGFSHIEPNVAESFDRAISVFSSLKVDLVPCYPDCTGLIDRFSDLWALGMEEGCRLLHCVSRADLDDAMKKTLARAARVQEGSRRDLISFQNRVVAIIQAFFCDYDLLLTPSSVVSAFLADYESPPGWPGSSKNFETMAVPFSMSGCPAVVVPFEIGGSHLPNGIQIVGPIGGDRLVLRAAFAFERAVGFNSRPPVVSPV